MNFDPNKMIGDIAGGLKPPLLLALVTLNVTGMIAAAWFLHSLLDLSTKRMDGLLATLNQCLARP